jgi:endonuclease YncB( thermonuclease family)
MTCPRWGVLLLVLFLAFPVESSADFSGLVVGVIDGDTIDVLHGGQAERIRLNGIDCPEKGQAFGKAAKQFTSSLAYGKKVTIQVFRKDRHGRTVGDVLLPVGTNVSRELLKAGLAWWYRQYSKDRSLEALEQEAREAKRGLWSDPHPIPPWEVRHPKKSLAPVMSADLLDAEPLSKTPDTTSVPIIGNLHSHVYHRPDCPSYTATKPQNRQMFNSVADAEAAGYHRAANCP